MATPHHDPEKPAYKAPEQKPFKMGEPDMAKPVPPAAPVLKQAAPKLVPWKPIASAPQAETSRFMVRATVNGRIITGTETVVRYRMSRKMSGGRWTPSLAIIDDRLGTKLGFRPTEWRELRPEDVNETSWDAAIEKANQTRENSGE